MDEFTSALDVADRIRAKEVSPSEVMGACLARVDERNPALNAVVWRDDAEHLARARSADDHIMREGVDDLPPFFGVPMPIKDLDPVAGWPVTYGSNGAGDAPATETSIPIAAMERAGFVLATRTNTPEFGTITATENERYGITRNPWDLTRTPGGSSGGAAAAVAAGMFPIAHATDGGGSIRIPASCCGLVGLKVSRGRIPDWSLAWEGAAVNGVVSHTVADTAAALDALAGPDPLAWSVAHAPERPFFDEVGAAPSRLRVAVLRDSPLGVPVDPECLAAVDLALGALAEAGHEVVDDAPELHIDEFISHFGAVVSAGLAVYDVDWTKVQANNATSREAARQTDSLGYVQAVTSLQRWSRRVGGQWGGGFDVLVTPTLPIQPAPAGQTLAEALRDPAAPSPTVLASVSYTAVFNMNGLPAISLPLHQAAATGLPIGVQLVGGPMGESVLLRLASQLEDRLPWSARRAPIPTGLSAHGVTRGVTP